MDNEANSLNAIPDVAHRFKLAASLYRGRHYKEAYSIYETFAMDGDVSAQVLLGGMYRDGLGVPANVDTALKWFKKAIAAGSLEAMFYAGRVLTGENRHCEALPYYQAAALHNYAPAIYWLGRMYTEGQCVSVDCKLAAEYLARAAAMGHLFAKRELAVRQIKSGEALTRLKGLAAYFRLHWEVVRTVIKDRHSANLKA